MPECRADEYEELARQLHDAIAEGQTVEDTAKMLRLLSSEPVPATGNPAPDVWSSDLPPGGYVCGVCGQPTESEPCPDHQAATPDLALYDLPALSSEPVPATGNPEEIDVDALARAIEATGEDQWPSCAGCGAEVTYHADCDESDGTLVWQPNAEAIAAEYARQREGERP